jgi:hypothetical protein
MLVAPRGAGVYICLAISRHSPPICGAVPMFSARLRYARLFILLVAALPDPRTHGAAARAARE